MLKNNWCPEIYRNLFIDRFNSDLIRIAPCCQAKSFNESSTDFDFKNSKYLSSLRKKFDRGEQPSECNACWQMEKNGHKSRRQSAIEFYNINENFSEVILEGLDHSVTWACNLACVMCGPHNSSLWANELNYNRNQLRSIGRLFQKNNNVIDNLDIKTLKKLHFNGGEPLLNNDQFGIFEKLQNAGVLSQVFISYNTNGTHQPSERLINFWKKTKLVKLFFSIDGTDSCFNYVRWPATWDQVKNNIIWCKENLPSNVMFGFNVTVGCYNIFEIADVHQWFIENIKTNHEGDQSDFNWQIATNFEPAFLSMDAKTDAIKSLDEIPGLINYIESTLSKKSNDVWISKLEAIDTRRSTNWKKSLKVSKYY